MRISIIVTMSLIYSSLHSRLDWIRSFEWNEQTNERTNERRQKTNEGTKGRNERRNERMNEQTNERTNERMNERTNERTSERENERTIERTKKRTNERDQPTNGMDQPTNWLSEQTNRVFSWSIYAVCIRFKHTLHLICSLSTLALKFKQNTIIHSTSDRNTNKNDISRYQSSAFG